VKGTVYMSASQSMFHLKGFEMELICCCCLLHCMVTDGITQMSEVCFIRCAQWYIIAESHFIKLKNETKFKTH
jgi:hypothetical protein